MGIYTQNAFYPITVELRNCVKQDVQRHLLGIATWGSMGDTAQEDLQLVFQKVLDKEIGWKDINNCQFEKAKIRFCIIHFFNKVTENARCRTLPASVRNKLREPKDLVVNLFLLVEKHLS